MSIKDWFKPNIEPMNHIYISKSNISFNYKYLQSLKPNAETALTLTAKIKSANIAIILRFI